MRQPGRWGHGRVHAANPRWWRRLRAEGRRRGRRGGREGGRLSPGRAVRDRYRSMHALCSTCAPARTRSRFSRSPRSTDPARIGCLRLRAAPGECGGGICGAAHEHEHEITVCERRWKQHEEEAGVEQPGGAGASAGTLPRPTDAAKPGRGVSRGNAQLFLRTAARGGHREAAARTSRRPRFHTR